MIQERFDNVVNILTQYGTEDDVKEFKRLWMKYQQYKGAMMLNQMPTINVYYDNPKGDA
jgi:DNA gyrase inhibitor GyrI